MLKLFKDRNFSLFWFGEMVSVVGDHISLLAFPWLVLQMTGSAALTGLVFAAQGVPRAFLMLAGGILVDRTTPKAVMIGSNALRMLLVMTLAYMITQDIVDIVMVFVMAFAFGVADAFFYPASTSILPSIVSEDQLTAGNAIVQTTLHLGMTVGPVVAGLIIAGEVSGVSHQGLDIAAEGISSYHRDRDGLARAFFVDGLTFALSLISLMFVKPRSLCTQDGEEGENGEGKSSLMGEAREALAWVWSVPAVRLGFIGMAVIHFFFMPMIYVALPVLANERFVEGAYVYGLEMAAYGGGAFLGAAMAGLIAGPGDKNLVPIMYWFNVFGAASLTLVILYEPYWWAMLLFSIAGLFDAFFWVHFTTWLQKRTPGKILGRVMSLLMFMSLGLVPIADALMGFAIEWNVDWTMIGSSVVMVVCCIWIALNPQARVVEQVAPKS
ncbi:MAG: MFS transporter [Porticoccaceae bacterium]|nr:MFS transporter [Porticoccaceae bacterium]